MIERLRQDASRRVLLAILTILGPFVVAISACDGDGASGPSTSPTPSTADITGVVWQVSDAGDGTGSMLVVGLQGAPGDYDRASVTLTKDTTWWVRDDAATTAPLFRDMDARPTSAPALGRELIGRRVAVVFTGAVAESYPVQATASSVALIDPLGVSMHITLAGEPQLRGTCVAVDRDEQGSIVSLTVLPDSLPAQDASGGGVSADVVRVKVKITDDTYWVLDTPTEMKSSRAPLIGNGLEPQVDVLVKGRAAEWVVVHLRDLYVGE